nr:MAG TPA: hypothetical protein [Caudoviricetes sp.]
MNIVLLALFHLQLNALVGLAVVAFRRFSLGVRVGHASTVLSFLLLLV